MMEVLPSSSKSISEDDDMECKSEEEIALIAEVKNNDGSKKNNGPRKQKSSRRNPSCSITSKVLAEIKTKKGTPKKKSKKTKLKRFDKCIKRPNDDELLIDLTDDEDIPILEEDDLIEIVEHIRNDSMRTGIVIDLTDDLIEDSESMEEGGFYKPKKYRRSKSAVLVDLIQNNELGESSSKSTLESPAVTDIEMTPEGVQELQELAIPGCSSDYTIANQDTPQKNNSMDPEELCKLFIGGLNDETTSETLKKYFEKWGEVFNADVKTYPGTNRSRCFGFVLYTKAHMVDIVQKNRPHIIDGRLVSCRRFLPAKELSYPGGLNKELFIPRLQENIKHKDLVEYFKNFGDILHCNIVTQSGRNELRRFGFISFRDYDSVDKILILRCHKIKGFYLNPRVCLTREQLAERDLKYYLKYFGGFNDWPVKAIGEWIKRHPDICNNNYPFQMNIERLQAMAATERYIWESYWARSRTYSTTSSVSISVTHKDHRTIEMARMSSPMSQTTSQASCSTSVMEKEKIKIEIDSDGETDVKFNSFNKDVYFHAVKEEHMSPINEDLHKLEAPNSSHIKTEPMA